MPLLECVLLLSSAFLHVQSLAFSFSRLVFYTFRCIVVCAFAALFPPTLVSQLIFVFLHHNLHCDSSHAIIVQADTESSVSVCISLSLSCSSNSLDYDSSDLILNLFRYRQPIWIDMITDRTARGHATWKPNCVLYSPRCLLLRVGREEEDKGSQCAP